MVRRTAGGPVETVVNQGLWKDTLTLLRETMSYESDGDVSTSLLLVLAGGRC